MNCDNCTVKIPSLEERHHSDESSNVPFVWWTPEPHYACSEECYRVKYLGCEPNKKLAKKKSVCPDCRALRGRCSAHQITNGDTCAS